LYQLRQYWQQAGVIFTPDVSAFEAAKLRLLNAPHSMMAYLGCLLGVETVFDAMQQPALVQLLQTLVAREILPQVPAVAGLDLAAYSAAIFQRFRNPQVRHLLAQIAWDGSQKLPMRLLPALQQNLKQQQSVQLLALAIACWLQFLRLRHSQAAGQAGQPLLVDPLAPLLLATAAQCSGNASTDVALWLALDQVFAAELAGQPAFVSALQQAYQRLTPLVPLSGAASGEAIDIETRNQQVLQQLLAYMAHASQLS